MTATTNSQLAPTVEEFDRRFDEGEDMGAFIDWSKATHLGTELQRTELDLPAWMHDRLASEADRRGVSLDALIKMWLADRLEERRA